MDRLPEVRAFDSPRAWPLVAYCLASVALLAVAAVVAAHRDAGAGVIAPRPGPARGSARAAAPWMLALRLERTATGTCLTPETFELLQSKYDAGLINTLLSKAPMW